MSPQSKKNASSKTQTKPTVSHHRPGHPIPNRMNVGTHLSEADFETKDLLAKSLRAQGFRMTPQREQIIDIFYELPEGEHLSAEELQHKLKHMQSDISLATSYRTLKLMASLGVLRELDFAEDHKHYELARNPGSPHHHIICLDCGGTEEFESDEIFKLAKAIADEKGLQVVDVQVKVFAYCQCDSKGKHNH